MTKPSGTICTFIVTLLAAAACFADNANTLSITGAVTTTATWDVAKLKQQFSGDVYSVQYSLKSKSHTSNCVSLLSVLNAAGIDTNLKMDPKADPKTKHRALRLTLIVRARDGYAVTFSVAELLPQVGNHPVWIALDVDGADIVAADGPMRLIVPDDATPARWVRAIELIEVVDASAPATQPAK